MTGIYIILVLTALCGILVFVISALAKRVKRYRQENEDLRIEINHAAWRVERMKQLTAINKSIREAANEERRELNKTADGGLVGLANSLFGMRGKPGGAA
jgi:cell division septum initiation protein DivIVA